jgi:hypothetical protein
MPIDWLFTHANLLTMDGLGIGYVADGAVAVTGDRIVAVGPTAEVVAIVEQQGGTRQKMLRIELFFPASLMLISIRNWAYCGEWRRIWTTGCCAG